MKLGISTGSHLMVDQLGIFNALAIETNNIEIIEGFPISYSWLESNADKLKVLQKDYGLTFNIHSPYALVNLGHEEDSFRKLGEDLILKSIDWLSKMGGDYVNTHIGTFNYLLDMFRRDQSVRQNHLKKSIDSLRRLARHAEDSGIVLTIEHDAKNSWYIASEDFDRIFEEVGSDSLRFTLDTYHAYSGGKYSRLYDLLDGMSDRLYTIHLSDVRFEKAEPQRVAVGDGELNWTEFFSKVKERGFDNYFVIETDGRYHEQWMKSKKFLQDNKFMSQTKALFLALD